MVAAVLVAACTSIGGSNPIANAGGDQKAKVGAVVTLSGNNSSAPSGGTLTYNWSFKSIPNRARAPRQSNFGASNFHS